VSFYEFDQNNSGGHFVVDDKLCHRIYIEAESADEANFKAEELGCYFDGVGDCSCCGDRWYRVCEPFDFDSFSKNGYPVSRHESVGDAEQKWQEKYGEYTVLKAPEWITRYNMKYFEGRIIFNSLEEYIQFLSDEYGWTKPDARIYYADGTVKEIFKKE
jgi:hypothetical protein